MCRATPSRRYEAKNFRTVQVNGSATLWLFHSENHGPYRRDVGDTEPLEIIRICFNFEESSFKVEERKLVGAELNHIKSFDISIWKNIMYWGNPADRDTRIVDFTESTCEKTKLASDSPFDLCENDYKHLVLGDETFLIYVSSNGWKVWCFDRNIQMANEDLEYRQTRWKRLWLGA